MRVDTISTFPGMFDSVMGESMMKRAQEKGALEFNAYDLRDWTHDRHRTTDDYPYGGGIGLVMKCEPIFECLEDVLGMGEGELVGPPPEELATIVIMAPQGRVFDDSVARELAAKQRLVFLCGHYEGMDERIYSIANDVISLGDYVLTSGELASMVVIDAVVRKLPGVLGAEGGAEEESFSDGLLEFPQYTRPSSYRGMDVPEVLLSGHHANIESWRRKESLLRTARLRPDLIGALLASDSLTDADRKLLESAGSLTDAERELFESSS